ncbi:MAG: bifunctional diaminohydroxyphosphoribosylaminopyrimidine deaminase/5-amino-6-(5-phosphoribosylamino)uracil reductase RibD [Firmicutes bacterium]|nr:bifunctional diaminohydroxyphosphoribosylaminopyrimidine deaminase/5-amino-6-(5-phosphoribosylamino)uracil reductase RibD [Bacillota bacterium]
MSRVERGLREVVVLLQDEYYMKMALDLAARARGRTSPNPMVGAVVVKDGVVIGKGCHLRAGTPHAEIHALREAGEDAAGATLYVTLEPCCHHGRTGPCSEAVIEARVARVVVAMTDPNPKVCGGGIRRLKEAGIEVAVGVLEEEAAALNEAFIKYITARLPFVLAKAAMSLDGKIATSTGRSRWITGPESRAYAHQLRDWYDAILVGRGTVLADDPSLTARLPGGGGRDPVRVILDSRARVPLSANVFNRHSRAPAVVAVTSLAPAGRIAALEQAGAKVVVAGEGPAVDLPDLLKKLAEMEITSVLIEGGAAVHASAFEAGVVDKVAWFVAPKIIGGAAAPGPVGGRGVDDPSLAVPLDRMKIRRLGGDFCLEGYVRRP